MMEVNGFPKNNLLEKKYKPFIYSYSSLMLVIYDEPHLSGPVALSFI